MSINPEEMDHLMSLAQSVVETSKKKGRMTCNVRTLECDACILNDADKVKSALKSKWWLKTYLDERPFELGKLLMLTQLIEIIQAGDKTTGKDGEIVSEGTFRDPEDMSGEEIVKVIQKPNVKFPL